MEKAIKKYFPVFALPTLVAFTIGFIVPFIMGIYLSFCEFTTVTDAKFVGLKNYLRVFSDSTFMHALWFTALFTIVSVLTINVFAFVIAMLLTKGIKGTNFFRFYAKPYWWYRFRLYLADPAEWNLRSFWKNTYLFFFLWILGIDHFNELAAGRLYDDHLYRRYPEYSGRADRGGKNGRGVRLAVIEECYDSNGNAIHHDLYILNTDELFQTVRSEPGIDSRRAVQ